LRARRRESQALGPAAVCLFECLRGSPRLARPRFVCLIQRNG
jgi:hypothetical protein